MLKVRQLGFEPKYIDLLLSLLFLFDTVHDVVGTKFGAVVEQGEVKMICEYCSKTVQSNITTSYMWLFEFN